MWSGLTTRSFISPLTSYVERTSLREVHDVGHSRRDKGDSFVSMELLSVSEAGDASEAFLRVARNRLL